MRSRSATSIANAILIVTHAEFFRPSVGDFGDIRESRPVAIQSEIAMPAEPAEYASKINWSLIAQIPHRQRESQTGFEFVLCGANGSTSDNDLAVVLQGGYPTNDNMGQILGASTKIAACAFTLS